MPLNDHARPFRQGLAAAGIVSIAIAVTSCGRGDADEAAARSAAPGATAAATDGTRGAPSTPQTPAPSTIEEEVARNILEQPIGTHTVRDLALPDVFVRRFARRVIRDDYRDRTQRVAGSEPDLEPAPVDGPPLPPSVRVVTSEHEPVMVEDWRRLGEMRPPSRGFRPACLNSVDFVPGPEVADDALSRLVAERLARDGLALTLALALEVVGPDTARHDPVSTTAVLATAGFPVDLLRHLWRDAAPRSADAHEPAVVVRAMADALTAGADAAAAAAAYTFRFTPSDASFSAALESGEDAVGAVRVQLTRGRYWRGPGAGGSLDLTRQVLEALPGVELHATVGVPHADDFQQTLRSWPLDGHPVTVRIEPLPVAQWAHDSGKPGTVGAAGGRRRHALLVPRYASRRDDGSAFVAGETLAVAALHGPIEIVPSPLLFQGGNLLVVRDPRDAGRRLLLAGEAEIHRNVSLGLTAGQAGAALALELGCAECVVLPSVSFHIDYDVSVRTVGDDVVAFVNDPRAAARIVLRLGAEALAAHGSMTPDDARMVATLLQEGRDRDALVRLVPALGRGTVRGAVPMTLAERFAVGPTDSPVGNVQRFMTALDTLTVHALDLDEMPDDRNVRAYLTALRAIDAERDALHALLRDRGFRVVPVPSLAEGVRSLHAINALHDATRVLVPAYGGFYAPLDQAAQAAWRAVLPPDVAVVPILSAESQRRSGAVHCAVSAFPRIGP